jgi:hypothetical protein
MAIEKKFKYENTKTGDVSIMTDSAFLELSKNPLSKDEKGKSLFKKLSEVDEDGFVKGSQEAKDYKKSEDEYKAEKEANKK